jgi:thiol-disulfide isomerase/thioredoxin
MFMSTEAFSLPQGYQIVPSEGIQGFLFYEDRPFEGESIPLNFTDNLKSGKVQILHLWATSCPSCVEELKALEAIARDLSAQPITFVVLSLNDPQPGVLRNYFNRLHYDHLKPYHRPGLSYPPIKGLPTTLFFNKAGRLVGRMEGAAAWQSDEMRRLLKRLCEEETQPQERTGEKGLLASWIKRVNQWLS